VVGTDDTTFTLTTPRYGATVSSPLTVGGRVTGVDESIRVTVLGRSARPLGEHCCLPAGGERRPWSAKLRFSPPEERDDLLTVVASTGGHVADVERFAITAVRPRR
jgi:Immunoglobulin-like domain of bacterial spore germination.